jgi:uncharacterized integral membrane protein (TIGR00697 family)
MVDVNVFWWIVSLLTGFGFILFGFKLFGKTGLYIMTAISMIIVNIQVLKTIEIFGLVATLGNVLYGTTFLTTDILGEVYNDKKAKIAVYVGFFALFVTMISMTISLQYIPHESDFAQESLVTIFAIFPRVAFASTLAYLLSQFHDVWAYAFWKKKFTKRSQIWIRNNASTVVSQLIDSTVFCFIAFAGLFEWSVFWEIFFTTFIIKFVVALLDTPFIYIARKWFDSGKYNILNI